MTTRLLAVVVGLTVFWIPPAVALFGGRVANALVLLTPAALVATIVWVRACQHLLPISKFHSLDSGIKVSVIVGGFMMAGWVALAVSIDQNFTAVFVTFIGWTIIVAISPFGVWWYNRLNRLTKARETPERRISRWMKEQPPED